MKKNELREKYLKKREMLSQDEVLALSGKIFNNFSESFTLKDHQKVHCFLSIPEKGEVDTQFFLNTFFKNNIRVFVPKIYRKKLISVEISSEIPLLKNSWGISEPESNEDSGERDFDYVLTPLLYCDQQGNRVGYGKGYYDGFFETVNAETLKIGLSFFSPEQEINDLRENDVPLDYLITPAEVLSFLGTGSKSTK